MPTAVLNVTALVALALIGRRSLERQGAPLDDCVEVGGT